MGLKLTDRGRVIFPYIFPKASLFSSQNGILTVPPVTPLNTVQTEAFWTWKLDRQILKGSWMQRKGVFRGFPFLGKPRPQTGRKMKGNEKSQEA